MLMAVGRSAHTIFKGLQLKKSLSDKKSAKIIYSMENVCWIIVLSYVPLKKCHFMPVLCLRTGQRLKNVG